MFKVWATDRGERATVFLLSYIVCVSFSGVICLYKFFCEFVWEVERENNDEKNCHRFVHAKCFFYKMSFNYEER